MSSTPRLVRVLRRKLLQAIPTIAGILVINFFLLQLAPGDAADALVADMGAATAETMAALRQHYGLDATVLQQFFNYIYNLAHFSLGYSPRYNLPVIQLIAERLPSTLLLMISALGMALVIGIALGAVMAACAGRFVDRALSLVVQTFYSIPFFWVGLMLIVIFSVKLNWLPSGGAGTIGKNLSGFAAFVDRLRFLILPAFTLSLFYIAVYSRLTRAAMLEVRSQDYVRTAAAKGLSTYAITVRHILRNALLPVTTVAGMHFGSLLGGAVVIETVFSWPGLGRLAYDAITSRDFNVLLGILLLSSVVVLIGNILVDLLQAWLDPRIEVR